MKTLRNKPHSRAQRFPKASAVIDQRAKVRFKTGVLNPDGTFKQLRDWKRNLILDSGLDSVASRNWVDNIAFGVIGTGNNPTDRDSGAVTVTVVSGVATASAAFFEAQDVGRLLRLDTGETGYITAFTSTTEVDVSMADAGPGLFTIYYVNDTQLETEHKRSNSYSLLSAGNGSVWAGSPTFAWTFTRTFIFSAEAAPVTITEVGWSWGANPTALFGRQVLSGIGDSLLAGQQYVISVELTIAVGPSAQVPQADVGTNCDTTGDAVLESAMCNASAVTSFAYVASNGAVQGPSGRGETLEPWTTGTFKQIKGTLSAITLETNTTNGLIDAGTWVAVNTVGGSFTPGVWTRKFSATFAVAQLVGDITAVTLCGGWPNARGFTVLFDTPITKTGLQTFSCEFTLTWNREF